ncbi:MAG: Ldh family oxidoreductase [Caldilineaceae bacterium]|nr:Ldh family oxidoreductase [Caldilineaceae bacterium]
MAFDFLQVPEQEAVWVQATAIQQQMVALLQKLDVPADHSRVTAEILTFVSLHGVDTHGAGNILNYCAAIEDGFYTIPQRLEIVSESETTALLDGGNGLGFVSAHRAMELSIEKARRYGVGTVTVRNGHHVGMAGYYAMMAGTQDMLGFAMTNAVPVAHPLHGSQARLGTNPIAFAAPAGQERPFLLDMATTTVANGKISLARRLGVPIPAGWAVDAEGNPITDPPAARSDSWTMTPLGNSHELGGHKGYGLAVMVDILCGVLSGGGFGAQLQTGDNMTWTMAVDIARFRPVAEFKAQMDEMIRSLHATPAQPGHKGVQVAGDPEFDAADIRREKGIPFQPAQYEAIVAGVQRLGVERLI